MAAPEANHNLELLAALSRQTNFSVGCYCESKAHCHRSVLRAPLVEKGASVEQQEAEAFTHVRKLRGFYLHLFRYTIVVLALLAINLIVTPGRMWAFWVMGGWGLGLLLHASRVFRPDWLLGPQWERQQVEKHLGRSL